jgi:hypothetical protein
MSEVQATLDERGGRYGDFSTHALIAQSLHRVMQGDAVEGDTGRYVRTQWKDLSADKRQALTVVADKIARILNPGADPEYRDNFHDIQGYAKLAEDRCKS